MKLLYVVGIGPGEWQKMTLEAEAALTESEIIVGYTVYIDLLKERLPDKEYRQTGMRRELERCKMALELAGSGKTTAVVCSGDAGVYGMAGLILELAGEYPEVEVQIVAGVSAALSGAAVLGAPLGHDFAVISLSDLLTPWEVIEKRLLLAAEADFCICLYNPSSHKRQDYLRRACEIILQKKPPETVCGYVRNIGRTGETAVVLSLAELKEITVDMFTTVFIGNTATKKTGDRMVTPRGYRI